MLWFCYDQAKILQIGVHQIPDEIQPGIPIRQFIIIDCCPACRVSTYKALIKFIYHIFKGKYIHLCAKFWLGHNKTITKTTQLSIITLAKANLNMSCFLVKIYSLATQFQFLDQKIKN